MRHKLVGFNDIHDYRVSTFGSTNSSNIEEMKALLRNAVNSELTEKQKYCVVNYYFGERKMKDIADELGVNPSTVTRHIQNAKRRLERIAKYY